MPHVYVWADALNNYITAVGYGQKNRQEEFNFWWPADLQVLGKDIVRFHAVYWPAFLMASGLELPKKLLVHGWIKVGEQKMSKSLGNVIDPEELLKKYGAEPIRYYLTRHMAITQDSEFSISDLEQRINSDLAHDLGNLLNRTVALASKNNLFSIQTPTAWSINSLELREQFWNTITSYQLDMADCFYNRALSTVWKFISNVNAYFHNQEPWKIAQKDPKLFTEIIAATCNSLQGIGILLWPVMPLKMEKLLSSLGSNFNLKELEGVNIIENLKTDSWHHEFILKPLEVPLFEKIELKEEDVLGKKEPEISVSYPAISIDDLLKVILLVGTITECQPVEKSDKLFKLQVDFGPEGVRQILSGIKQYYQPEELIGKQAVFVFNLQPRTMMKLESHGMVLTAADSATGKPLIITPAGLVPNGTRLK